MEDKTPKLRRIEGEVERRIREMRDSGALHGLTGEGRPLAGDDAGDPATWAARRVMQNAGAAPVWVDLRKDIEARTKRIRVRLHSHRQWLHDRTRLIAELPADRIIEATHATIVRDTRVRTELETAIGEVNALVRRYDLIVPAAMQLPLVTMERLEASAKREDARS